MWRRLGMTIAFVTLGMSSSIISYQTALAVRSRDYSPSEFRSLLHNFGYNVTLGNTLEDEASRKAIREFQQGYRLTTVDGTTNAQTQDLAADLVRSLQGSLNIVLKLNPPLPCNQFYGLQTEAAIRRYQKQYNLEETGIANLELRQQLDMEAKKILGAEQPSQGPNLSPSQAPNPRPSASP